WNAGGGCTAGGIPALRREQLHHRGGDRHRRRFICLAPTGWAATGNSAVCALTGHSGRPSGPIDRVCDLGPMASCATVTPPINPAHYTHESGGPAAAPLLEVSRSVPSSHGAVDAVRFSAARQFSPGARIAQAAEQGRKYLEAHVERGQKGDDIGRLSEYFLLQDHPAAIVDHAHRRCLYRHVQTNEMLHLIAPSSMIEVARPRSAIRKGTRAHHPR